LSEFNYINPALPPGNVQNAQQAMDWIIGVVYPQTRDAVDTPGDLPAVGNAINDYRVVLDDGDGKAAGYRWMQLEGDLTPQWYKINDMDWGEASILSNFLLKTQDVYVYRYGIDDLDETGSPYAGDLAGQRIYGGQSANTHLTLYANSGDGVGAGTGFVQFGDNARPLIDSAFALGSDTYRFLNFYTDEANVSTMQILGGSITDSSGAIDFDDEDLSTSGTVTVGTLLLQSGSITDTSGSIDFSDESLTTTGLGTFDGGADVGTTHIRTAGVFITEAASGHDFSFTPDGGDSTFTGTLSATGDFSAKIGTLQNQLIVESLDTLEDYTLTTPNTGYVTHSATHTGHQFDAVGTTSFLISDTLVDNLVAAAFRDQVDFHDGATNYLRITNARIDSLGEDLTVDGGALFTLEASTGITASTPQFIPSVDDAASLGIVANRWEDLFLSNAISDGTNSISMTTLLSFRDALVGAAVGHSLFYNGTLWFSSIPDTEVDHGSISGIGDDDHSQYALLAGRSGGQSLIGGSDSSDNLLLDSTSDVTKGQVRFLSVLAPNADNTLDIGSASLRVADLYMGGEGIGFRMQNVADFASLPAASASNNGRLAWTLDTETIYVDKGGVWKQITTDKYVNDDAVTWDGTNVTQTYTTSGDIDDARNAVWQFLDNTNSFRQVQGAVITKTLTQVTVTFTIPPASGTYRLVGVG